MDQKEEGGTIINKSGKTLIIAFDSFTEKDRWGYMILSPNRKTVVHIDADGFRVRDAGIKIKYKGPLGVSPFIPVVPILGWWKIRNGMLATVKDDKDSEGNSFLSFEAQVKYPGALVEGVLYPASIGFSKRHFFAVGSAIAGPLPKTDKDYDWDGSNMLMAEASEPVIE